MSKSKQDQFNEQNLKFEKYIESTRPHDNIFLDDARFGAWLDGEMRTVHSTDLSLGAHKDIKQIVEIDLKVKINLLLDEAKKEATEFLQKFDKKII